MVGVFLLFCWFFFFFFFPFTNLHSPPLHVPQPKAQSTAPLPHSGPVPSSAQTEPESAQAVPLPPSWACPAPGRGPGPVAAAPSAAPLRAAWRCVPSGHLHGDLAPQVLPSPPSTAALQHRHPAWRRGLRLGLPRRLRPFHFQTPSALVCGH